MKDSIILEGKIYISARRAAKIINYAQDYIGQLCRAGKLDCKMVGRSWFVTEDSLLTHREGAVDSTQERVLKIIKNNDVAVKEEIKAAIVAPILSPISPVVYEPKKESFFPELKKKVPSTFSLPKNISNLTHTPFVLPSKTQSTVKNYTAAKTISVLPLPAFLHSRTTALVIALLLVSGFIFTMTFSTFKSGTQVAENKASIGSAITGVFTHFMQNLGLMQKNSSPLAARDGSGAPGIGSDFNGIGVVPASGSVTKDEAEKAKIISSFSDEVTVKPDKSGTAGVIKPVFKEGNGEDFLYVLVPVKEKKQ